MTIYTVQCGYVAYYANIVVVEAESLDEALEAAIGEANRDTDWKSLDHCGDTFVDAVTEGEDVDPWQYFLSAIPVPDRFTEQGRPPTVTVTIEGGLVEDVTVDGGKVRVLVRDYDTDGLDPSQHDIQRHGVGPEDGQRDGKNYTVANWTNGLSPHVADQKRKSATPPGA